VLPLSLSLLRGAQELIRGQRALWSRGGSPLRSRRSARADSRQSRRLLPA